MLSIAKFLVWTATEKVKTNHYDIWKLYFINLWWKPRKLQGSWTRFKVFKNSRKYINDRIFDESKQRVLFHSSSKKQQRFTRLMSLRVQKKVSLRSRWHETMQTCLLDMLLFMQHLGHKASWGKRRINAQANATDILTTHHTSCHIVYTAKCCA